MDNNQETNVQEQCDFCDNAKYVQRMNTKGVMESFCVECLSKIIFPN